MSILQGLLLTTISSDAQDAEVVLRLLPDEVIVRNVDKGLAKLEVDVALGFADVARHLVQVGARLRGCSLGEGLQDLVEDFLGQGADGVAAVEEHRLAVGLVEDRDVGAIGLGDGNAIEIDPVTGLAVGRLGRRNDGTLLEVAGELLGVDSAKHNGAAVALDRANVQGEGTAVGETLRGQVVNDIRVRAVPAVQARTSTEDTSDSKVGVVSDTEHLLAYLGSCVQS